MVPELKLVMMKSSKDKLKASSAAVTRKVLLQLHSVSVGGRLLLGQTVDIAATQ